MRPDIGPHMHYEAAPCSKSSGAFSSRYLSSTRPTQTRLDHNSCIKKSLIWRSPTLNDAEVRIELRNEERSGLCPCLE